MYVVTFRDIIISYKKMEDYDTLWFLEMDHTVKQKKGINKYDHWSERTLLK